jgi:hypothetical protein
MLQELDTTFVTDIRHRFQTKRVAGIEPASIAWKAIHEKTRNPLAARCKHLGSLRADRYSDRGCQLGAMKVRHLRDFSYNFISPKFSGRTSRAKAGSR